MTQSTGAVPPLDPSSAPRVLGAPEGKGKGRSHVGHLKMLLGVIAVFLICVAGLMIYQRSRAHTAKAKGPAIGVARPDYATKNEAVDNASIEKVKAEIKHKEHDEEAQRQALADEEARKRQTFSGTASSAQAAPVQAQARTTASAPPPPTPQERKMGGSVLFEPAGNGPQHARAGDNPTSADREAAPSAEGGIAARLQPTVLQARSAGRLPNLDYLLTKGMTIPCALQTGIDTTLPGFVVCKTLTDVYSANGKTLLLERGSTVFGEQQSALTQGQARAFVLWTRIDTPSGVFANIDSPATDQQGYSGVPGFLNTHFWARFGGAIMLSVVDDFAQAAAQRAANAGRRNSSGGGNNTLVVGTPPYQNTMQSAKDMAAEALRSTINIPPTLTINPGTVVHVMVARDVSFENVFTLLR